ncbi:MAG: DUF6056 family protein [Planctomycetaceae bacterium]|nr:DUF6056 family protein [Planctomycetaceae bacterium]
MNSTTQNNIFESKTNTAQELPPCACSRVQVALIYSTLGNCLSNATDFYFTNLNANKLFFGVVLFLIFVSMLLINFRTPLVGDDYVFSLMPDGRRVETISDATGKIIDDYLHWGGRVASGILTNTAVLVGKPIFNFFNAGIYTLLCLLIYLHTVPRKTNLLLLLGIHFGVWFFSPVFGQTILWLNGATVYMWGTALILLFLLPYRWLLEKQNVSWKHMIWLVPVGLLAGNCGVNVSVSMILLGAAIVACSWYAGRKIPLCSVVGLVCALVGFAVCYFAPGMAQRAGDVPFNSSFIVEMMRRFVVVSHVTFVNSIGLILVGFLIITLFTHCEKSFRCQKWRIISLFLFASFVANYIMVMSPMIPTPPRAYFGAVVFLLIAVATYFGDIPFEEITLPMRRLVLSLFCGLVLTFPFHYGIALLDVNMTYTTYKQRQVYIEEQKKLGNLDIVVPRATPMTLYNPIYDAPTSPKDVQYNTDHWINKAWARYYNINSILPEPRN